ncbi:MAG: hypothetical protein M3211_11010 [Actinomycetota bacterium]|nr:hypothetical protein [Actinomycetota bacterium]
MIRRFLGMARGRAMRGGAARPRPGMGGPRPGPRTGAGGNAEIQRGVRSVVRGFGRRRRGL